MKKLSLSATIFLVLFASVTLHVKGQTYAFRLVKAISQDGEVRDINSNSKVYVTFSNNRSSFYLSKRDGSRAGWPNESSGWASGFNNQAIPSGNYSGFSQDVRDPQNFQYEGKQGDIHVYRNNRPLLAMNYMNKSIYVSDYTVDYAKFNADFSRINVIPSYDKGMYGIIPFGIGLQGWTKEWTTFVFVQVKAPNSNPGEFY